MKCSKQGMVLWITALMVVAAFVMVGCEANNTVGSTDGSGSSATLEIVPSTITISHTSTTNVTFMADGGTPPYTWSTSDSNESFGTLVFNDTTAIYTPKTNAGGVFLTVTDSTGLTATATISQN